MPRLVKESHFGIAICNQDNFNSMTAAVPTKIGAFLSSGRPIIASQGIGDLDQMLATAKTGVVINHGDSLQTIAQQIRVLINDPGVRNRCGEFARQHFDMKKSVDRYLDIYDRMHY